MSDVHNGNEMIIDVVILAAGQGSRMKSNLPKVLHKLANKPLVSHVIDTALNFEGARCHLVVGHGAKLVEEQCSQYPLTYSLQAEQLGTGHAVAQATDKLDDSGITLVLYGDVPLTRFKTLQSLIAVVDEENMGLLTVKLDDPTGYGRIIRNQQNQVTAIVEHKDATPEQHLVNEVNTGILAVKTSFLKDALPKLSNNNAQGEYYLTDLIEMAVESGLRVKTTEASAEMETLGVNNKSQLASLEREYQLLQAEQLMEQGVGIADPARIDVRGTVKAGQDCFIDINTLFEGNVVLGHNVIVGPNCIIKDSTIGDNVTIEANSLIDSATVANACSVGPYARLRPGAVLEQKAKVGNFCEVKKSVIGEGSKVNHLTYIGDAEIGKNVNIGAGTITCNYDGVNKFKTEIGDDVFIGSNSSLVAPINIESGATVGAGSTITKAVSENALAIARGKQRNIENWPRPTKK